jgi:PIN domain nuclease of toxin-antitoxin system
MQLLVDSHALIWAVDSPDLLTSRAQTALKDATNQLFLSAATIWEIAIKVGTGKLSLALPYLQWMNRAIGDLSLTILPVTVDYANYQASLPTHHRDPFDRLLIAQSAVDSILIVSADVQFDAYGIQRVW